MIPHSQRNVFGIAGLAGCLFSGGFDAIQLWLGGGNPNRLLGRAARAAAALYANPPSLTSAGTDYQILAHQFMFFAYVALVVLFAILLWRNCATNGAPQRGLTLALAAQLAIVLVYPQTLLYLMSAQLGMLLPLRSGLRWMGAQNVLLTITVLWPLAGSDSFGSDGRVRFVLLSLGTMMVWQAIAFGIGFIAATERRARVALAAANAELRATHLLLLDTVRSSERLRIARDLHDIVGHHLTAMRLHLDLAVRRHEGEPDPSLITARTLATSLLSEVRVAVGTERNAEPIALREALAALCEGIPMPRIALRMDDGLEVTSAALAHALFCCVQEAISNAVRHAGANELSISLERDGDSIALHIADDGKGSGGAPEGHGLRGMRERLAALGGTLRAINLPQHGFKLDIAVPAERAAA